jgi:hypothetical protein
MTKTNLQKFISKYALRGNINSVKWAVSTADKTLNVKAITDDKTLLIDIVWNNFTDITNDVEIGVYETDRLEKMLKALSDEIAVSVNENDGKITSLNLSDANTEIQFMTAELSVIPKSSSLKKTPPYELEIELTKDFTTKFKSAKDALSDEDKLTFLMGKKSKKIQMVLGYSSINSNRITLDVPAVAGKDTIKTELSFNANYFKSILDSNGDCENAVLKVSESGLASVQFICGDFTATYHMTKVQSAD